MLKRILTSMVGLVVFFAVLFLGEIAFTIGISAVTLCMLYELYKSINKNAVLSVIGALSSLCILASIIFKVINLEVVIIGAVFVYLIAMVGLHGKLTYKDVCSHGFLTVYITTFFGSLIRIYNEFGVQCVLIVFVCAWMTDTGAYFTGCAIGKHKLIPKVSPKKTIEGAIGGIIVASLSCALYLFIIKKIGFDINGLDYITILIIGFVTSIFSQIGDLVASAIKRDCEVKDFGNVLPGHGGFLDRFDSVIYIAPLVYYLLSFLC